MSKQVAMVGVAVLAAAILVTPAPAATIFSDNFEGGVDGNPLGSPWSVTSGTMTYSNADPIAGGLSALSGGGGFASADIPNYSFGSTAGASEVVTFHGVVDVAGSVPALTFRVTHPTLGEGDPQDTGIFWFSSSDLRAFIYGNSVASADVGTATLIEVLAVMDANTTSVSWRDYEVGGAYSLIASAATPSGVADGTRPIMDVRANGPGGTQFDEISLTAVPEPSGIGMMLLGGLMLIGMKRRR